MDHTEQKVITIIFNVFSGMVGIAVAYLIVITINYIRKSNNINTKATMPVFIFGRGYILIGWIVLMLIGLVIYYIKNN